MINPPKSRASIFILPSKVRRKLEFALRTSWATFLCMFVIIYWELADVTMYVAPVVSIFSSALYLGQWQAGIYKTTIGIVIGGGYGIAIGYTYHNKALQFCLFFLGSLWMSKMPGWDRMTTILATTGMILGTIWPLLTNDLITGAKSLRYMLALMLIPYVITGFSLLFPKPGLAIYVARSQALLTCRKLSLMVAAIVNAFKSYDYLDSHLAEFDQWLVEVRTSLTTLRQLQVCTDFEKIVFVNMVDYPAALKIFIDVAELIVQELVGIQDMVKVITYNHTQIKFVEELSPILVEISEEMEIALTIVGEYFENFRPFSSEFHKLKKTVFHQLSKLFGLRSGIPSQRSKLKDFYEVPKSQHLIDRNALRDSDRETNAEAPEKYHWNATGFHHYNVTKEPETSSNDKLQSSAKRPFSGEALKDFEECIQRLVLQRSKLVHSFNDVRRVYIFGQIAKEDAEAAAAVIATTCNQKINESMKGANNETTARPPSMTERLTSNIGEYSSMPSSTSLPTDSSLTSRLSELDLSECDDDLQILGNKRNDPMYHRALILTFREENLRLSLRNLGPRSSYIHRMSVLVEYISSLQMVFKEKGTAFSLSRLCVENAHFVWAYVWSWCIYVYTFCHFWFTSLVHLCQGTLVWRTFSTSLQRATHQFIEENSQPIKISAGTTLTLVLMRMDWLKTYHGGLWTLLVMALIRQDSTSSSFFTSYQRLEGTVIGAVYAVVAFQVFKCGEHTCSHRVHIPVIIVWLFICMLFREGPQHGYAAIVASFTPVVLLLGIPTSFASAWGRIEENFIGIVIYLVIDNLIFPKRTFPVVRQLVLKGVDETRVMFSQSVKAVEVLVGSETMAVFKEEETKQLANQKFEHQQPAQQLHKVHGSTEEKEDNVTVKVIGSGKIGMYGASTDVRLRSNSNATAFSPVAMTPEDIDATAIDALLSAPTLDEDELERQSLHQRAGEPSESAHQDQQDALRITRSDVPAGDIEMGALVVSVPEETTNALENTDKVQEIFLQCNHHLDLAEHQLKVLKTQLAAQASLLAAVVYEPEIFHRPFPLSAYQRLHQAFAKVYRSAVALNSGSRAFAVVLKQMLRNHETVARYLEHFTYMAKYMFLVAAKADVALKSALDALSMLYEHQDFQAELTSLLTFRRICDRLLRKVDEHFRTRYVRQSVDILTEFNPYFIAAWQNVFESTSDMVRDLSELGSALLVVRNAEALTYC